VKEEKPVVQSLSLSEEEVHVSEEGAVQSSEIRSSKNPKTKDLSRESVKSLVEKKLSEN